MLKKTKLNNPNIQTNSIVLMYHLIYLTRHNISILTRQNKNQPLLIPINIAPLTMENVYDLTSLY